MSGFWNNKSFNTSYAPNTDLLAQMSALMNTSSPAAVGQAIGKTLTGLQQNISNANSAEYARQLETMSPLEVLQMEAKGLHPKTAKLGNGFIYNPEDTAIQTAYNALKTNTQNYITNATKAALKKVTDKQRMDMLNSGKITPEGLLELAGINSKTAYANPTALQTSSNELMNSIYNAANADASDYFKSLQLDDPRQVRFWSGDNSYFTSKGYSPEQSQIMGDRLRNDPVNREAFSKRLIEQYNADQAKNYREGKPIEAGDSWIQRHGYAATKLHLDTFDYSKPETAAALKQVQERENQVAQANALNTITDAVRKQQEIPLSAFTTFMNTTDTDTALKFMNSPEGRTVLTQIKNKALGEIQNSNAWKTALDPTADELLKQQAQRVITSQINDFVTQLGLEAYPEIQQQILNNINAEGVRALQTYADTSLGAADAALRKLRDNASDKKRAMSAAGTKGLLDEFETYLYDRAGYKSALDQLDKKTQAELISRIKQNFAPVLGDMNSSGNAAVADVLIRIIANHALRQNIDKVGWNDQILLDYLMEGNNINALYAPQDDSSWFNENFTNRDDVITSMLFGRNKDKKLSLTKDQEAYIKEFRQMIEQYSKIDQANELLSRFIPPVR